MSVGFGQGTREAYDNFWGNIALQVDQLMMQIAQGKSHLDAMSLANLEALPSLASPANPYSAADAQQLKNLAADLDMLRQVRQGIMFVPQAGAPTTGTGYSFPTIGQCNGIGQVT